MWALKADAHECVKRTAMFAAGPFAAPVADDGGGGHSEDDGERERDEGESGGRVKLAVTYRTKNNNNLETDAAKCAKITRLLQGLK